MSELLTTGEMIDRLKVGEVGKTIDRIKEEYIHRNDNGFYWGDNDKQHTYGKSLVVNDVVANMKWVILPKYVTFEEAMKAFKDGKTVTCYSDGFIPHLATYNLKEDGRLLSIHYERILDGKWQIIE